MSRRSMSSFVKNPLQVAETIDQIFGDDLHAKRVLSLANSVVGTVDAMHPPWLALGLEVDLLEAEPVERELHDHPG